MYDGFFIFLVWTSALNSALAGIGIVDYFFLRGQKLDMHSLHRPRKTVPTASGPGSIPSGSRPLPSASSST